MSIAPHPTHSTDSMSQTDSPALIASRDYCRRLTRAQARNFYYGLRLLPEPRRSAMYALYAYMRLTDDIADDGRPAQLKIADLTAWEHRTLEVAAADSIRDDHPLWPAFREMISRFNVPLSVFTDAIEGQRRDLQGRRYNTFADLREYCRLVAGVVGVGSIHIWGFTGGPDTEALALARGEAFQLTNILRDLREDASLGRTYFPAEDLARHGLSETDLATALQSGALPPQVLELLRFYIAKARAAYELSSPLEARITPECRPTLVAMTSIYRGLLDKIEADPARILRERVSLSIWTKLKIGWTATRQ